MTRPAPEQLARLRELAWVFLKLGTTAFGGPAAHIGLMENEIVRRRGWLTHEEFLDLLGATNLIPGPNSTEMAIHIGLRRAGWAGLATAGACFILPATLIVTGLAWVYTRFGSLPEAAALLYGVKPVIIAIVVQALFRLGHAAVKTWFMASVGVVAALLNYIGLNELVLLFSVGLLVCALAIVRRNRDRTRICCVPILAAAQLPAIPALGMAAATVAAPYSLWGLFLFFLKVGSVLFGSGYVLLAFLRADLVERWHWLSENQLLDAIAVGQITPGPLFTTATFIGYLLGGFSGGLLATVGIFLPAFVFVAASAPWIPRLRASPIAGAFLDGVNVASLALMLVVTMQISAAALVDWMTLGLALASGLLLIRRRVNSAWLVFGGAVLGVAKQLVGF